MDTGRDGHGPSKSMKHALLQSMWQDNRRAGTPITLDLIRREIADYREIHYAQEGLMAPPSGRQYSADEWKALKKKVDAQKALSGVTNIPCAFDSVEIKYWVEPMLHITLGKFNT